MMSQESGFEQPKSCPFCGEVGITIHAGSTFRWMVAECTECGATCGEVRVQTSGDGYPDVWKAQATQAAVAAWNTRIAGRPNAE